MDLDLANGAADNSGGTPGAGSRRFRLRVHLKERGMRVGSIALRILTAVTVAGSGVAVAAEPAAARAEGCSILWEKWGTGGSGAVHCTSGYGYYRAVVYCTSNPQGTVGGIYRFGPWKWPDASSQAACPSDKYFQAVGWDQAS